MRQAVALGLIGVVVGEMFGGSEGIGYMVNYGGQTFQTDTVFLGVVIIAGAGIIAVLDHRSARATLLSVETGAVATMADIVLGIGSSHGPLLSTPADQWELRAKADRANKGHWFRGRTYDYETLLKERAPGFRDGSRTGRAGAALRAVPRGTRHARSASSNR